MPWVSTVAVSPLLCGQCHTYCAVNCPVCSYCIVPSGHRHALSIKQDYANMLLVNSPCTYVSDPHWELPVIRHTPEYIVCV